MRALDSIARLLVLILSGLATFAIIASLMSVSHVAQRPVPSFAGGDPPPPRTTEPEARQQPLPPPTAAAVDPAGGAGSVRTRAQPTPPAPRDQWLEALTYAVLGLAGFVAVGVLTLMRATAHLGALADRR